MNIFYIYTKTNILITIHTYITESYVLITKLFSMNAVYLFYEFKIEQVL